jgi:hypothetical protein
VQVNGAIEKPRDWTIGQLDHELAKDLQTVEFTLVEKPT